MGSSKLLSKMVFNAFLSQISDFIRLPAEQAQIRFEIHLSRSLIKLRAQGIGTKGIILYLKLSRLHMYITRGGAIPPTSHRRFKA